MYVQRKSEFPSNCGLAILHYLEDIDDSNMQWYDARGLDQNEILIMTDAAEFHHRKPELGSEAATYLRKKGHRVDEIVLGKNLNSGNMLYMYIIYPLHHPWNAYKSRKIGMNHNEKNKKKSNRTSKPRPAPGKGAKRPGK